MESQPQFQGQNHYRTDHDQDHWAPFSYKTVTSIHYSSHSSEGHCAIIFIPDSVSLLKHITIPLELSGLALIALAIRRGQTHMKVIL